MNKKNKKILTVGLTGLATVPAIVTPLMTLASCGNSKSQFEAYDKEYGVDKFVYNTVEKKFEKAFNAKVDADVTIPMDVKPLEKERNKKVLASFRQQLNKLVAAKDTKNFAYTAVSNAMIDYAEREYGIKLNRETKASFSDIDRLYRGIYDAWQSSMINSGMNPGTMNAILQDAQNNFDSMRASLTTKYTDALAALIKAKRQMAVVFAAVSKDIGLMAASIRLQEFFSNYSIEYNETNSDTNKLDKLKISTRTKDGKTLRFVAGTDITPWMNDIFQIRDAHTGNVVETGFRNDMIPGYKITPVLHEIKDDLNKNTHSIEIDWQCVKNTYTGKDAVDATAHLFNPDECSLSDIKNKSIHDVFNADHIRTSSYIIPQTAEQTLADLKATYPKSNPTTQANEGLGILFKWDEDKKKCAYEPFLRGVLYDHDDQYNYYELDQNNLADSGLLYSTDNGQTWKRLDAITRSISNGRQLEDADLVKNLSDNDANFVKNCVITGEVITKKSASSLKANYGDESHYAKVTLHYQYANETGEQVRITIDDIPAEETSGFPISENAFRSIINRYNITKKFHENYKNDLFEQDLDQMHTQKVLEDVAMGLTAVFDVLFIATSLMPTKDPLQKKINIAYVVTSAIDLALQITSFTVFRLCKYNTTKKYANKAKKFKATDQYKALDEMLTKDREKYHLIDAQEDGAIVKNGEEEGTFDYNYDHYWKNMKDEDYLELLSHYSEDHEHVVIHNYKICAEDNEVNIDQYHSDLKGWERHGWCNCLTTAANHGSLTILAIQMILGFFDPSIKAAIEAKRPVQAARVAAETASKNLWWRMIDMFKALYQAIKNIPTAIKNFIQMRKLKVIFNLIEKDPEVAKEMIRKIMNEIFHYVEEFNIDSPLLSIEIHGQIYKGEFENLKDLLKHILSKFPCIPKGEAFAKLSVEEAKEAGKLALAQAMYDNLRSFGKFMDDADPLASEFTSLEELLDFVNKKFQRHVDAMLGWREYDANMQKQLSDLLYSTTEEGEELMDKGYSLFQILRSGVLTAAEDAKYLLEEETWGVFFIFKEA